MIAENAAPPKVTQVPGREHIWAIEADGAALSTLTSGPEISGVEVLPSLPRQTTIPEIQPLAKDGTAFVPGGEEVFHQVTAPEK
jgi:hypothetical protein